MADPTNGTKGQPVMRKSFYSSSLARKQKQQQQQQLPLAKYDMGAGDGLDGNVTKQINNDAKKNQDKGGFRAGHIAGSRDNSLGRGSGGEGS